MALVAGSAPAVPTTLAPLPRWLAYTQSRGLERCWDRPTRGLATVSLGLLRRPLAWRGSGRPGLPCTRFLDAMTLPSPGRIAMFALPPTCDVR